MRKLGVLGVLLSAVLMAQAPALPRDSAIVAIDAAIKSLRETPNQFSLAVNVTGVSVSNSGGVGLQVTATGGGPGSTTTGMIVDSTAAGQQITIARQNADEALKQEADKAIRLLTEIKTLLQKPPAQVEKPKVASKLGELAKTYVAPVMLSIIEALIKARLGL